MARPTMSCSDELLEQFDDTIFQMKVEDEIPRDASRSDMMRKLMRAFVTEHDQRNAERSVSDAAQSLFSDE